MTPLDTARFIFDPLDLIADHAGAFSPAVASRAEPEFSLLASIDGPQDLRALPRPSLRRVVAELRQALIETVAATGGHLSSNLGTVELAVALHYVLDTPHDRVIWDVGHQCYAHKMLTYRREAMHGLRMAGGISGFPRRCESAYDAFGTAHSSTSISAALGMAVAAQRAGRQRRVVAVIGDGAMSAGMAFEALNNAVACGASALIVLNDNEMSISPSVGGWLRHLAELTGGSRAGLETGRWRGESRLGKRASSVRSARADGGEYRDVCSIFEQLGIAYHGPVDGHDVEALACALEQHATQPGVSVLHVLTRKGQGYLPAEREPTRYHGVGRFDPADGLASGAASPPSFTQTFGDWLCECAARDPAMIAITPAMIEGSGMVRFAREYPERCFDVGIAEQHALTFAAGLACEGAHPVVAIYSTFMQRAFDQYVHDVQLQNLPVLFAIDRAGLVGADGPTHHGAFDLSYLRCIPNLTLMVPSSEAECRRMLDFGLSLGRPAAVRYPRGGSRAPADAPVPAIEEGRGVVVRRGHGVALLAFGPLLHAATAAADTLDATVVDMRFVKPLDAALIEQLAASHDLLVTLEDNALQGGAGSAVLECLAGLCLPSCVLQLGLPDRFIEHGDQAALLEELGLGPAGIVRAVNERLRLLASRRAPAKHRARKTRSEA